MSATPDEELAACRQELELFVSSSRALEVELEAEVAKLSAQNAELLAWKDRALKEFTRLQEEERRAAAAADAQGAALCQAKEKAASLEAALRAMEDALESAEEGERRATARAQTAAERLESMEVSRF